MIDDPQRKQEAKSPKRLNSECSKSFTAKNRMKIVILLISFSQGIARLSDLAISYLYKDDFGMSPAQVAVALGISDIPWIIKPIWGMISDSIPLFGYRRRSYLILLGLLGALCYIFQGLVTIVALAVLCQFVIKMGRAFCNVIGEALLVEAAQQNNEKKDMTEKKKQEEASTNVALFFGIRNLGTLISSYASGYLLGFITKIDIFLISMSFPLIVALAAFMLPEKRIQKPPSSLPVSIRPRRSSLEMMIPQSGQHVELVEEEESQREPNPPEEPLPPTIPLENKFINTSEAEMQNIQLEAEDHRIAEIVSATQPQETDVSAWRLVWQFLRRPEIYKPLLFILIFRSSPANDAAMFFFYTNKLGFSPDIMGEVKLAGAAAGVLGMWMFNRYFKTTPFKTMFTWSACFMVLSMMSQMALLYGLNEYVGISNRTMALCSNLFIDFFYEMNLAPILVLACRMCPKNIEGTMYALLTSILNLGASIADELGALCIYLLGISNTSFDNLWALLMISSVLTILPVAFVHMVDFGKPVEITEKDRNTK
jgi:folate/biopterin transporter